MKSIKDIYKIGTGPSSSHTMGPAKAMGIFVRENPDADSYEVTLYGSLSDTGRGHGTDVAIESMCNGKPVNIIFNSQDRELPHENTMDIRAVSGGVRGEAMRVMSVGGGDIKIQGREDSGAPDVYPETTFSEIAEYCKKSGIRLSDYVVMREGEKIYEFLAKVWQTMTNAIHEGLTTSGILPGGLNVERKAQYLYNQHRLSKRWFSQGFR